MSGVKRGGNRASKGPIEALGPVKASKDPGLFDPRGSS